MGGRNRGFTVFHLHSYFRTIQLFRFSSLFFIIFVSTPPHFQDSFPRNHILKSNEWPKSHTVISCFLYIVTTSFYWILRVDEQNNMYLAI